MKMGLPGGVIPPGTPIFSGESDWHEVHFDLGAFAGAAQIRFRFLSDSSYGLDGWYIDDVMLDGFELEYAAADQAPQSRRVLLCPIDPNPFARTAVLRYQLPDATDVLLQVLDPSGRVVRTLVGGRQRAGVHEVSWDGRDGQARTLSSGLYFVHLTAGETELSRKLILAR
jgi:hypothetical protein